MPNYMNPYQPYPYSGYTAPNYFPQAVQAPQMSYTGGPQIKAMEWVEGEIGAKAFQMPQNWPANQPIPLWDSTDTVIWLKSWNPMGVPNQMQRLKYDINQSQQMLPQGQSGETGQNQSQQSKSSEDYATKDDLKELVEEIRSLRETVNNRRNQNNQNGQSNRGGNNG